MPKDYDEPFYIERKQSNAPAQNAQNEIKNILLAESFAVLATQAEGQPFCSLISYLISSDFKKLAFATPVNTKKFELISKSDRVSILVDTRSDNPESINRIKVVTITGKAKIVEYAGEKELWVNTLIAEKPYLKEFVKAPTSAIIVVNIHRYFYVRNFQEVTEWDPN